MQFEGIGFSAKLGMKAPVAKFGVTSALTKSKSLHPRPTAARPPTSPTIHPPAVRASIQAIATRVHAMTPSVPVAVIARTIAAKPPTVIAKLAATPPMAVAALVRAAVTQERKATVNLAAKINAISPAISIKSAITHLEAKPIEAKKQLSAAISAAKTPLAQAAIAQVLAPKVIASTIGEKIKQAETAIKAAGQVPVSPALAVAIKAAASHGVKLTPASVKAAANLIAQQPARAALAAGLATKAVLSLAKKAPVIPSCSGATMHEKAKRAVAPIAHACGCRTMPVIHKIRHHMSKKGYPHLTTDSLLASLSDMNDSLEKAALQRLATHEHLQLTGKAAFEHDVLKKLARLSKQLPNCHPTRTRAHLKILGKVHRHAAGGPKC